MKISEFQELMRDLYFDRDAKRGVKDTFNWFLKEVEELKEAINKGKDNNLKMEFADVFAWLTSLANVLNVNLEVAAILKYNYKCPKCNKKIELSDCEWWNGCTDSGTSRCHVEVFCAKCDQEIVDGGDWTIIEDFENFLEVLEHAFGDRW